MLARCCVALFAITAMAVFLVAKPPHVRDYPTPVFGGCHGWLFLGDELAIYSKSDKNFAAHLAIIGRVASYLAQRGVKLVVVPIPDKSRIEAKQMCRLRRPEVLADRLDRMIADLRDTDIKVVDIQGALASLDGDAYYRTDSHWNQRGGARAAEVVAEDLREWGLAPKQRAEFQVSTGAPHERIGDLMRIVGLDRLPAGMRPPGDEEGDTTIRQMAGPGVGLLDVAPAPELVLLGTSFSEVGKLGKFLAVDLRAPVDDRSQRGSGLLGSAKAYFASRDLTAAPPRTVVWEIPERFMQAPADRSDVTWSQGLDTAAGAPGGS
jgi:alginate O-acetyltransferase complex protein AlgJ